MSVNSLEKKKKTKTDTPLFQDERTQDQPLQEQPPQDQPLQQQPPQDQPSSDQPLPDQPLPNQPLPDQPLPDQPLPNQPLPDQPLPDQPLPDQPLPDQPLPDQPLPDQPLPDQPLPDQPLPDQPLPDQPLPDQPLPDQTSQDVLSQSSTSLSQKSSTIKTESEVPIVEVNPLADILTFTYSYGYDCHQPFNLCVVEENILVYYSGTLIHIFDHSKKMFTFRRSFSGSGIGHIVKNPLEPHLALGEKCPNPLIIIYEWPSFDIISKMTGGTTEGYSHLGYSPDGTMLVSQGSEPDHLITIWDWKNAHIILRVKSHGQDVVNVEFSQFVPGQLTSCGLGHIKFWKMVKTFTGLKLQGELGRFGKTELCDIRGICAMPDEKVISGSEWGNLLVWEDRLIKLEVKQKAKGNCHNGDISQIHFDPITEDIISVGMDGWIKSWNRVTIDGADPPDEEDWFLEMQPLLEVQVKDDFGEAKLMSLCKKNDDPDDNDWFGQDANGGIWSMSLNAEGPPPKRLFICHAGPVAAMATSPMGHYLSTLGSDGCLFIYDTMKNILLAYKRFKSPGTALIWLPIHVDATGAVLVGGFADGMLRMIVVSLREIERALLRRSSTTSVTAESATGINIIQRIKSHTAPVTFVCLNPRGSIVVSGSEDCTIFIYQILPKREYIALVPIGYLQLPGPVTYITWMPKYNAKALVACADGSLTEVDLPEKSLSENNVTYDLSLNKKTLQFMSIKSELIRAQEMREIEEKKEAKLEKKRAELERVKEANPNLDIDEELFLMDSDDEVEFPPLYYPETPSPILFVMLLPSNNVILSMGDYDSGFLYEYTMENPSPVNNIPVPNAMSIPLHCTVSLCDNRVIAFGMANGVIRLVPYQGETLDMEKYFDIPMHDNDHGVIHHLCCSHDGKWLFSCGSDGNIFMYKVDSTPLDEEELEEIKEEKVAKRTSLISGPIPREIVPDIDGTSEVSLEETKRNAQNLHLQKLANEHKENIRRKLANLQLKFDYILSKNNSLPTSQILPRSEFELDPRITKALEDKIKSDDDLMHRQMAFKVALSRLLVRKMQRYFVDNIASLDVTVRAIQNENLQVKAFTHNKLSLEFLDAECDMQLMFDLAHIVSDQTFDFSSQKTGSMVTVPRQSILGSIYKIQTFFNKLTLKARKALYKQQMLKNKRDQRAQQWQLFLELKPDINQDDPNDIGEYENAAKTIGDFNLKSADTYKVPQEERVTPAQKYWQMIKIHREIFETKEAFNEKVRNVRDSKIAIVRRFKQLYHDLDIIQEEIPPELRKERLPIPKCYLKNNFPEHIFRLEFGADPLIYHPVSDPYDEEYDVLRLKYSEPISLEIAEELPVSQESSESLSSFSSEDDPDTLWERQLKVKRMVKALHKQNIIIKEMQESFVKFDDKLEKLSIDRLKYARDIKLMEIFYLTLYQELVIINSYAGKEHEITLRINNAVQVRNEKFRQKMLVQDYIDSKQQDITVLQMKLSDLQEHVNEKTLNTKFAKFLNRIFKKKRTTKSADDSESESSSSEESSSEEFEDDDNEDYVPIKLDENVCPEGCDPNLYEDIITSRNLRYEMEDNILELRKQLEKYQKELQICNTDSNKLDLDVQNTTKELEAVQFEKQQKLNNVETIVVLNLSQFRHFVSTSHPEDGLAPNPLVFHSEVLFKLSNRIGELEQETAEENLKIKQQKLLMQRLNKRCKEMGDIKKSLKKQIEEELIQKFGAKIDIDKMEETILRKMLNQARRDYEVDLLRKNYDRMTRDAKNELWRYTDELIVVERENSRRLKLQTMLEHETWNLKELLRNHEIRKEKAVTPEELERYKNDIRSLEEVLNEQLKVNEELKHEIRILSYKCTPPEDSKVRYRQVDIEEAGFKSSSKSLKSSEQTSDGSGDLSDMYVLGEDEEHSDSEKTLATIDSVLRKLSCGLEAYEAATAVVDELLSFTNDEDKKTTAMEIAMNLIDQLIHFTSGEETGDVTLVELYAGSLVKLSETAGSADKITKDPEDIPKYPEDIRKDPEDNPTDPEDNPKDPGENPKYPEENPKDPADNPEEPGDNPKDPEDNPKDPGDNPKDPEDNPMDFEDLLKDPEDVPKSSEDS